MSLAILEEMKNKLHELEARVSLDRVLHLCVH